MTKCVICEQRPSRTEKGYCHNCNAKIVADRRNGKSPEPVKFLHYRGTVVGLYRNGNGNGTLRAELLKRDIERLPKGKLIDLDHYCEGYSREQVKKFKRCVLRLSTVGVS